MISYSTSVRIAQKLYIPSIINTGEPVDLIEKSDLLLLVVQDIL